MQNDDDWHSLLLSGINCWVYYCIQGVFMLLFRVGDWSKITQRESVAHLLLIDQTDWSNLTFRNVGLNLQKLANKTTKIPSSSFLICKSVCRGAPHCTLAWCISAICLCLSGGVVGVTVTDADWSSRGQNPNVISVYFSSVVLHLKPSCLLRGYGSGLY